ncbi:MAG TPA: hypothetical protein VGJ31_13195, partial [Dongiaceae bacterium]
ASGVRIGEGCAIYSESFSTEPYLVSIGSNCIIGAGAVVRGRIPDNSLVIGNPGQAVGRASLFIEMLRQGENSLDTLGMEEGARRKLLLRHFWLKSLGGHP